MPGPRPASTSVTRLPLRRPPVSNGSGAGSPCTFPIVGLGSSAGGLDAFKKVFDALPPNSGMAFVLIPHLDPSHASTMRELLTDRSVMPVVEASDGMPLEPDHVYLIPPGNYLAIDDGVVRLSRPRESMPFDIFLRSLASIERALEQRGDVGQLSGLREAAQSLVASLTARQRQVMNLVMAGHPSKNIAADLGISQRTVDNHRAAIMKKTGSKSLPALVRLAITAG